MIYYSLKNNGEMLIINKSLIDSVIALNQQGAEYTIYASSIDKKVEHIDDYIKSNPMRNFVIFDFTDDIREKIEDTLQRILNNPRRIIYRLTKTTKKRVGRDRLLLELDQELNKQNYAKFTEQLQVQMRIKLPNSQTNILHAYSFKNFKTDAVIVASGDKPLKASLSQEMTDPKAIKIDSKKLENATIRYLNSSSGQKLIRDRSQTTKFFDSLSKAKLTNQIDRRFLQNIIDTIAKQTQNIYTKDDWFKLLKERLSQLGTNKNLLNNIEPLTNYIHRYLINDRNSTLGQLLLDTLPKDTKPSPDYDLDVAGDFIETAFPPYLLDQEGEDIDNLVIYNPLTGIWTHEPKIFYALLTAIKPYSTDKQLDTLMATFAAKARNVNRFIKPYHGSRYNLFNNCVLDVKTMKTIDLNSSIVHDLHFTERCHLDLDYKPDPPLPVMHGLSLRQIDGVAQDWNPRDFLLGYANNDPKIYQYFLFGLALGFFGGHNFGVHFDIKGGSRWGKSTLMLIYITAYHGRVVLIDFARLNTQFPFTTYAQDTSVIWIDETNDDAEPLNNSNGTTTYDNLADNSTRFQVKHKGDYILQNPPQVYLTGTGLVKANDIYTGPAGRTLAFVLPPMTDKIRNQAYSSDISACLGNKEVIEWIVYNALVAYHNTVPMNRIDDFKMILNSTDINLIPKKARDWRKELVIGGSLIDDWYEETIEPYLSNDPKNPTYLHERIIYALYLQQYNLNNPNDSLYHHNAKTSKEVFDRLKTIWESDEERYTVNYQVGTKEKDRKFPRKQISSPGAMNFDWKRFDQDYERPSTLQPACDKALNLFNKKAIGWISVYKKAVANE